MTSEEDGRGRMGEGRPEDVGHDGGDRGSDGVHADTALAEDVRVE